MDPDILNPTAEILTRERAKPRVKAKYKCTSCGRDVGRRNLKAKRVQFKDMGEHGAVEMTRTTDWLCMIPQDDGSPSCLEKDPDYHRASRFDSPGMKAVG